MSPQHQRDRHTILAAHNPSIHAGFLHLGNRFAIEVPLIILTMAMRSQEGLQPECSEAPDRNRPSLRRVNIQYVQITMFSLQAPERRYEPPPVILDLPHRRIPLQEQALQRSKFREELHQPVLTLVLPVKVVVAHVHAVQQQALAA